MILPHGLEKLRNLIEVSILIHSADILLKNEKSKFEKLTNFLKNNYVFNENSEQNLNDIEKNNIESSSNQFFVQINFGGEIVIFFLFSEYYLK